MWQEDNDKILKIIDCFYDKNKLFPVNCPICAKKDGHIYLYRHNINSHSGGLWLWCSACHHSSHSRYSLPIWWNNLNTLDTSKLSSFPDYLEENKNDIDKWVNKIKLSLLK